MKLPIEWLKEYIKSSKSGSELAESFTYIGLMLDKPVIYYKNGNYTTEILDLEHRMDRSDWLSILGCARDVATFENIELRLPELYTAKGTSTKDKIKIEVQCPDLVNRFNTRVFRNIKVKPSPEWLKNRLEAYGIPSINNIVDITNYVMVELGQPMHAQDIAKLEKPEIIIRRAKDGEQITTLLGETLTLDSTMFVLTQNNKATVIGGIVGGVSTGIDETTTDIVLDAGNYNQNNIRKTSRKLKIQNETVLRYDKFLHPELTELAIQRATKLILELAGGEYYENEDWYPTTWPLKELNFTFARLLTIGGLQIESNVIKDTLIKLGYRILKETKQGYELEVPYFRTDVEVEDDIVSDILRMYGYKNIPLAAMTTAVPKEITPAIYKFEDKLRDICVNLSLHEHITEPLVRAENQNGQVMLENAQSQLKNALRVSIYDGLKTVAENYGKHKIDEIGLFEIGKVYSRKNASKGLDDFVEKRVTHAFIQDTSLLTPRNSVEVRKTLDTLLKSIGINKYSLIKKLSGLAEITVDSTKIGELGWDNFYLENEQLIKFQAKTNRVVTSLEQTYTDDISIDIPLRLTLGEIQELVERTSDQVITAEISPQNFGENTTAHKVLITVKHKSIDFNIIRDQIVKSINELITR